MRHQQPLSLFVLISVAIHCAFVLPYGILALHKENNSRLNVTISLPPAAAQATPEYASSPNQGRKGGGLKKSPGGIVSDQLHDAVMGYYPDEYVAQGIEGDVILRLACKPDTGEVLSIRVESPSPYVLFNDAALAAATANIKMVQNRGAGEVLMPIRFRIS